MSTPNSGPLKYSTYIGDEEVVKALDMPTLPPAGVDPSEWPRKPAGWEGDQPWPTGDNWVHDEVLFIRTHQAFEVWFALILHEVSSVIREAKQLFGGVEFEDPRLTERTGKNQLLRDHAHAWPKAWKVVQEAIGRDGNVAEALGNLWAPAQCGVNVEFAAGAGESRAFHHALGRWTERLNRAGKALQTTIPFFDVLLTMSPANFLAFRGRLQPASGFGSAQFREIEYALGLRELNEGKLAPRDPRTGEPVAMAAAAEDGSPLDPMQKPTPTTPSGVRGNMFYTTLTEWGRTRVARRARETSLRDIVYGLLNASFCAGSRAAGPETGLPDMRPGAIDHLFAESLRAMLQDNYRAVEGGRLDENGVAYLRAAIESLNESLVHRETVAATFLDAHAEKEIFTGFLEACITLDRSLLQWRDRHIRFVEGMIGTRAGTGGGGIRYLRGTTSNVNPIYRTHALPCLWQSRSLVQKPG
ncbi:MAG TPA: tryptophan 2,3-dioxygenase family protein [Phycisphaerales bacterium]|nr:tryptophan 2,3-dioxygenase family protein [Phycisphaerales bacterium]